MHRGKPAPVVRLSPRQERLLTTYRNKRNSCPVQYRRRIDIILHSAHKVNNSQLSEKLGVRRHTVAKWRNSWAAEYEQLCAYEAGTDGQGVKDHELLQRMLDMLSDQARCGSPKRISMAQENQIVALACRKPEEFGVAMTQWNREMLAKVAIAQGIVDSISPRYISEILKKKRASTA
jgi:hypothetical protein